MYSILHQFKKPGLEYKFASKTHQSGLVEILRWGIKITCVVIIRVKV